KAMGREELLGDERFLSNDDRVRHQDMIERMIEDWVSQNMLDNCLDILNQHGIPAGTFYNAEDIVNDPHYQARDMILEMEHEDIGKMKVPGIVPKLSKTPGQVKWLGPKIGEHNMEVLKEIGLTDEMIQEMEKKGVI
ncbi:CoA transferase, partial [Aeromonas veronii]|nr:CoA transferase [Aeromonas veronii]